jgi:catechol 2,3-dioxygenase-like lactoylglutathione lyase family enzyme
MEIGAFSISLAVKDITASRDFYRKLGFDEIGGDLEQKWLILRNGEHVIGLFEGMFEKNTLTFNPGWDQRGGELQSFTDVRELQRSLRESGIDIAVSADESGVGPASFSIFDPDGNPVLFDQHR